MIAHLAFFKPFGNNHHIFIIREYLTKAKIICLQSFKILQIISFFFDYFSQGTKTNKNDFAFFLADTHREDTLGIWPGRYSTEMPVHIPKPHSYHIFTHRAQETKENIQS